jgi:GxxExxY protein
VLGAVFEVSNTMGAGFLEKVYERALLRELALRGIRANAQVSLTVSYKGHPVGEYFADILVEDKLVVELAADGKYHIYHVNNVESNWDTTGYPRRTRGYAPDLPPGYSRRPDSERG